MFYHKLMDSLMQPHKAQQYLLETLYPDKQYNLQKLDFSSLFSN